MFHFTKKRAVAMAVVGSLALSVGAYAYFTSGGTGDGSATVGSPALFNVTASSGTGTLTPGGGTQLMTYTVTNPSSGHLGLSSVVASVTASDGSENANIMEGADEVPNCKASWFTAVASPDSAVTPQDLAGSGTSTGTVLVRMLNEPVSQDACLGKHPRITLVAS